MGVWLGRGQKEPVVNCQVQVASWFPARSRMPPAPPVTATVYLVLAAREVCGSRTHWLVVPFLKTVADTTAPVAAFFRVNVVPLTRYLLSSP